MRVVLDTDVMVAALRSQKGASQQLLLAALDCRFTLLVSVALMLEYEAVLTWPANLKEAGATREEVGDIFGRPWISVDACPHSVLVETAIEGPG